VALQEIGPRFTLKLRWLKSGIPAVPHHGEAALHLDYHLTSLDEKAENFQIASVDAETIKSGAANGSVPPTENALLWAWKVSAFWSFTYFSHMSQFPSPSWKHRGTPFLCSIACLCQVRQNGRIIIILQNRVPLAVRSASEHLINKSGTLVLSLICRAPCSYQILPAPA
jgi:hypothetical protein